MEDNTFAISQYIEAAFEDAVDYLAKATNLNEWTLFSQMTEQIDEATWLGTASGYQQPLYYHVRVDIHDGVAVIQYLCGIEYRKYFHVYPMFVFHPRFFGHEGPGVHFHWVSFVDPDRRTQMITDGLATVHVSEARSLKGHLERRAGRRSPSRAELSLQSHTIYVDAERPQVVEYLGDESNWAEWGYLMRDGDLGLEDVYGRPVAAEAQLVNLEQLSLIQFGQSSEEETQKARTPFVVVPASYAFGVSDARGSIVHRITPSLSPASSTPFKRAVDYDTEMINLKRVLEARAGNLESYARGVSYRSGR